MKKLLLLLLIPLCGCTIGWRLSHAHGNVWGSNIQTPYGLANGNIVYDATTCFGNCPNVNMEMVNAINTGSTVNSSK